MPGSVHLRSRRITALLAVAALAACGGAPRPGASGTQPADSGAAPVTTAHQARAGLAGTWSLRAENRAAQIPRLDLAIDSASGETFRVRVAFLMQGDVGIEPQRFEPRRGAIGGDGLLHITIKLREQTNPVGEMIGSLGRDTIRLRAYRWAGEDQTAGGTSWILVRQPS